LFGDADFDGVADDWYTNANRDGGFNTDDTNRTDARTNGKRADSTVRQDATEPDTVSESAERVFDEPGITMPVAKLQRHLPEPGTGLIAWSRESGLSDQLFNFLDT